ncbi:MAG: MYXO-CTERM sorting domain-containing protein [Nannocystaceae bacterium]
MFAEDADLPDIERIRIAEKLQRCDGHAEYTLPDGREVFVPNDGDWPAFADEMPWEEETQQMAMAGAPQVLTNNTETIDTLLADWNTANRPSYDAGSDSSGDGAEGGCGCTSESGGGGLAFGLALLGLAGLVRRRR